MMSRLKDKISQQLDNYSIKDKLIILYICCVLIPIIITDSVIIYVVFQTELISREHEMENITSAVEYNMISDIDNLARIAENILYNRHLDDFMEKEYESPLEYIMAYQEIVNTNLLANQKDNTRINMYVENDTIISGGKFHNISSIENTQWYEHMEKNNKEQILYVYYDDSKAFSVSDERKIIYVKKLNFYNDNRRKLVKLEMDYSRVVRNLEKMNYEIPVYICQNNNVIVSNSGYSNLGMDFIEFPRDEKIDYIKNIQLYGTEVDVYVQKVDSIVYKAVIENAPILILLILINIVLPMFLMQQINYSFTERLWVLSEAFDSVEDEKLVKIDKVRGVDEIGSLMRNYNKMVARNNDLIQRVYRDKLREQETNIAKQNAELKALHSQINPHFIFNTLESIRMNCVLKNEDETAKIIQKLALLQRQYVEWGNDSAELSKEVEFVIAYLDIQKFRFGERLSYVLDIDEDCNEMKIPKLTLVTFVENACIHGVEKKTNPSWIFVRAYQDDGFLYLEVEDTGVGMDEEKIDDLREKMNEASIELLDNSTSVGIINACLRLKMVSQDEVRFEIDGEKGIGTIVQIKIPLKYV